MVVGRGSGSGIKVVAVAAGATVAGGAAVGFAVTAALL
jgi:hypothetical protein